MEINIPDGKSYKNILFLSRKSIEELNVTLQKIDSEIFTLFNDEMEKKAEKEMSYFSNKYKNKDELIEKLISDKSSYLKRIKLTTKSGYESYVDDLTLLLKDETYNSLVIQKIDIELGYDKYSCHIIIEKDDYSSLRYHMRNIPDKIKRDFSFYIDSWFEKYSANWITKIWSWCSKYLSFGFYGIIFFLITYPILRTYFPDNFSQYEKTLDQQIVQYYKKGISSQEDIENIINLLIQKQEKLVPKNFIPNKMNLFSKANITMFLVAFLLIVICLAPKTCFEIGKDKFKFRIQEYWKKIILKVIPIMIILPIILNVISSKISK